MNISGRTLLIIFLFMLPLTAFAQIINTYETTSSTGETIVHRSVTITDPITEKPVLVHQIFRKNPDGTLSVIPGKISPELKKIHEEICAKRGGVDVTEKANSWITPTTIDSFDCSYPNKNSKQDKTQSNITPGPGLSPNASGTGFVLSVTPPNTRRTVKQGATA